MNDSDHAVPRTNTPVTRGAVTSGGVTRTAGANSLVSGTGGPPVGTRLAVAVMRWSTCTAGRTAVNAALPALLVLTVISPRNTAPSALPEAPGPGEEKNWMRKLATPGFVESVPATV